MGTRSFVGFCHNDELKGWYNAYDGDYFGMGRKVLEAYQKHDCDTLHGFFAERMLIGDLELLRDDNPNRVYLEEWFDKLFDLNWQHDSVSIVGNFDFFKAPTNTCSYVFNVDNDTVEIYHWYSDQPGFVVNRENVQSVLVMFNNWKVDYHWRKEEGSPYNFAEKEILGTNFISVSAKHFKNVNEVEIKKEELPFRNGKQIFAVQTNKELIFVAIPAKYLQSEAMTVSRIIDILPKEYVYVSHSEEMDVFQG